MADWEQELIASGVTRLPPPERAAAYLAAQQANEQRELEETTKAGGSRKQRARAAEDVQARKREIDGLKARVSELERKRGV